jgi:hypothetical protein
LGSSESPETSNADSWTILPFDGVTAGKMYVSDQIRVTFVDPGNITINELKFWTVTLADEILAQVLTLTGSMMVQNESGSVYIDADGITVDDGNITIKDSSGKTWIEGGALATGAITADKINVGTITADKYAQIRNIMPWNFLDNVDQSHPLTIDFRIPNELATTGGADGVKDVYVSLKAVPFRAYSIGASGGVHSHSVDIPSHIHPLSRLDVQSDSASKLYYFQLSDPGHSHTLYYNGSSSDSTGIEFTRESSGHYHNYMVACEATNSGGESTRTSTQTSHTHTLDYGIFENTDINDGGYDPADDAIDIDVYIDNGGGFPTSPNYTWTAEAGTNGVVGSNENYITQNGSGDILGSGWKAIRFEIATVGIERVRLSGQLIAKIDITA